MLRWCCSALWLQQCLLFADDRSSFDRPKGAARLDDELPWIGEHKYRKPILDCSVTAETSLSDGVKLALISMDSTLRSNLTVGLPVGLLVYRRDSLEVGLQQRRTEENAYVRLIRENWSEALKAAHKSIPAPPWF